MGLKDAVHHEGSRGGRGLLHCIRAAIWVWVGGLNSMSVLTDEQKSPPKLHVKSRDSGFKCLLLLLLTEGLGAGGLTSLYLVASFIT